MIGLFVLQGVAVCGLGLMWLSLLPARRFCPAQMNRRMRVSVCAYIMGSGIIAYTAVVSCFFGTGIPRLRLPTELLIMATSIIGYVVWTDARSAVMSGQLYEKR